MARDVNKDRRLGLGLGLALGPDVVFFTVTSFYINLHNNKFTVSYSGP